MARHTLCALALLGLGTAVRAGELDRESAPAKPVVAAAPDLAAKPATGTEMDRESPQPAHRWRGVWGFGPYYRWGGFYPAGFYRPFYPGFGFYSGFSYYPAFSYYSPAFYAYRTYAWAGLGGFYHWNWYTYRPFVYPGFYGWGGYW
jgi:hypothetical protein